MSDKEIEDLELYIRYQKTVPRQKKDSQRVRKRFKRDIRNSCRNSQRT